MLDVSGLLAFFYSFLQKVLCMIKLQSPSSEKNTPVDPHFDRQLLIVDDEPDLLQTLEILFTPHYTVRTAESGKKALELISNGFIPQVILADQRMPGMSGTEFLAQSMELVPQTVRVVLTGYTDVQDITDSINRGNVYRFLTKPWRNADLLEIIRACFDHFYLSEEKVALTNALKRLEALSREKSEILDIVVHDLKNPLGAIIGISDMIQNGVEMGFQTEDYVQFGREIGNATARMSTLIRNLLSMHALDSGNIEMNCIPLNLSAFVELIVHDFRTRAMAKNLTLHVSPQTEYSIYADEIFCHHIIENLLSNAIKYSPAGKNIWIDTSNVSDNGKDKVRFSVKDEGPGISAEDHKKMFQKFTRLSAQPTGGEDSTGLGLSIVKKFAEKMNARVWCESELGNGSTFVVEFPLHKT
jgi:two-component system sensor histidine kinase/response regulator